MKSILPILAVLAAGVVCSTSRGQQPPQAGHASGAEAEAWMDRVLAAADAYDSISAKVRHRVELMGRRAVIGTGVYLQQGRGAGKSFRLELKLRTTLFATSIQHVCDGNQLWILEEIEGSKNLSLIDVARLARARPKGRGTVQPPASLLAQGGLSKLLSGLQESCLFDRVTEGRLDELRVWSIEGAWNPARLAQLLPEQKQAIESGRDVDLSALAPNLPHRVVLHVGCDDLFPYRIEYWRIDPEDDDHSRRQARLIVVMELYEVQLGAPIDSAQFAFRAKDLVPQDRTKEFLDKLGLEDPPPEEAKRVLRSQL